MKIPLYMILSAPAHPTWLSLLEAAATCSLQVDPHITRIYHSVCSSHHSRPLPSWNSTHDSVGACEVALAEQTYPDMPNLTVAPQRVTADIRDRNSRPAPMPPDRILPRRLDSLLAPAFSLSPSTLEENGDVIRHPCRHFLIIALLCPAPINDTERNGKGGGEKEATCLPPVPFSAGVSTGEGREAAR